jgi:hypothetical protein
MKNFKNTGIVLGLIFMLFLFISKCKPQIINTLGGFTKKETTIIIDTVIGEQIIDTVAVFNAYVHTKGIILNPKPIIEYKYTNTIKIDSTKNFAVKIKDSVIDGTLTVVNRFDGELLKAELNYKPIYPKSITKTTPIYITKTIKETLSSPLKSRIGVGVGINDLSYPSINVNILTKENWDFEVNYTKPDVFVTDPIVSKSIVGFNITKYF